MNIYRAQKEAENLMLENRDKELRFLMLLENKPIFCVWLDPYMGLFRVFDKNGILSEGFINVDKLPLEGIDVVHQWVVD